MCRVVLSQEGQLNNKGVCYRQENINFQQGNKYFCDMVLFPSIWTGLLLGGNLSQCGLQIVWKRLNCALFHTTVNIFLLFCRQQWKISKWSWRKCHSIKKKSARYAFLDRQVRLGFWTIRLSKALQYVQTSTLVFSLSHALHAYVASR